MVLVPSLRFACLGTTLRYRSCGPTLRFACVGLSRSRVFDTLLFQWIPEMDHVVLGDGAAAEDDETLHDVVQLADVARPLELFQCFQRVVGEQRNGFTHTLSDVLHETGDQQRDVVLALPQRRDMDDDDTEPMV